MKRIIVISTSLRHGSNSDMLADKFVEGAKAARNEVEKISLSGKNIRTDEDAHRSHERHVRTGL